MLPIVIAAGDIELRRFGEEHVEAMVAAMELSLAELSLWFPWAQVPPSATVQIDRAHAAQDAFDRGIDYEYSLFETATDELVGGFRINPLAGENMAEFGYWVRSDRHRRGYATQAVLRARHAVFDHLPEIREIEVHMDCANTASERVASAAGFTLARQIARPKVAPGHTGSAFVYLARPVEGARLKEPSRPETRPGS